MHLQAAIFPCTVAVRQRIAPSVPIPAPNRSAAPSNGAQRCRRHALAEGIASENKKPRLDFDPTGAARL